MSLLQMEVGLRRAHFDLAARLDFEAGVTGLFGPSGSGKSTLLGMIAGLVRPQRGRIAFDGEALFDAERGICLPPHRRRIGLVFQDSQLFPHYSVKGNLLYGWNLTPPGERRFRFDDVVDLLALGPLLNAHPRRISGGEKQRVALGRSLLASPRLLLLDEPLASLDQGLKEQILPFFERVRDELGLPMIFVSHALPEILHLTDRLVLVAGGRITGQGRLSELLGERGTRFGRDNLLPVVVESHDIEGGCTVGRFGDLHLALPLRTGLQPGATVYLSLHRGEIALARQAVSGLSIQNQVAGRISRIEPGEGCIAIHIDVGAPLLAEITPRSWHELDLREGETVYCLIKASAFSYLAERVGDDGE